MNNCTAEFENHNLGLVLKSKRFFLFFGNAKGDAESITKEFSKFHFQNIKQIHSNTVVDSSDRANQADAHYTELKNTALFIKSADCLPVLVFCHQTGRVAAAHAGWKGVANQIVIKTLTQLQQTGSTLMHFEIWIGPHILQNSFEVDLDVLKQLELSTYKLKRSDYSFEKNQKYFVDLNKIVMSQIREVTSVEVPVHFIDVDTKTDLNFCSFRRDKITAGRNLSFIAALS